MPDERIVVQLASPERKYVKVYHDFLDNSFLTAEEEIIFIVLKSYVDFKEDGGEAFPSMETICKRAKMSEKRARKNINALIKKGIVKKVQRGLTKTNLYTLADYARMWACDNAEDVAAVVQNKGVKPLTPEEHIAELERMGYKVEIKEKGLESEPTKAQIQAPKQNTFSTNKDTTAGAKSQAERYSIDNIKELYGYNDLIAQYPAKKNDIDVVIDILYESLNSTSDTIRIGKEKRPLMVVIGKLMKLQPDDLIFSIEKYHEQRGRIKNVRNYLLAILYNSREQNYLDLMNLGHNNGDF